MRKLKFRAWDEKNKRWATDGGNIFIDEDGDTHEYIKNGFEPWLQYCPGLIIEQYIDRKDRNGKDVYEGDIFYSQYHDAYYEVVFHERYLGFFALTNNKNVCHTDQELPVHDLQIEIIGNIHENPELMDEG